MALTGNYSLALPGHIVNIPAAYVRLDAIQFDKASNHWAGVAGVYASRDLCDAVVVARKDFGDFAAGLWTQPENVSALEAAAKAAADECAEALDSLMAAEQACRDVGIQLNAKPGDAGLLDAHEIAVAAETSARSDYGVAIVRQRMAENAARAAAEQAKQEAESRVEQALREALEACKPLAQFQVAAEYSEGDAAHVLLYAALKARPEFSEMTDG